MAVILLSFGAFSQETDKNKPQNKKEGEIKAQPSNRAAFRPFIVPVVKKDQVVAYIGVHISVALNQAFAIDKLWEAMPPIRDDLFSYFYDFFGLLWAPSLLPDKEDLRRKTEEIIEKHAPGVIESARIEKIEVRDIFTAQPSDNKPLFLPDID